MLKKVYVNKQKGQEGLYKGQGIKEHHDAKCDTLHGIMNDFKKFSYRNLWVSDTFVKRLNVLLLLLTHNH